MDTLGGINPWEKNGWSEERMEQLYRDWGTYFQFRQLSDLVARYYEKSPADDAWVLYYRSRCKRNIAQVRGALEDIRGALKLEPLNALMNIEHCDCLYESNEFEITKIELSDNMRRFVGNKVKDFEYRLSYVDDNLKDSLGDSLGPFFLEKRQLVEEVFERIRQENIKDLRPLWKILKDQGKCDVLSILEKEEILLSPREIARRNRAFNIHYQIYVNRTWKDLLFLKNLKNNPDWLLKEFLESAPYLRHLCVSKYNTVKKFMKMLQARSPFYNENAKRCPDKRVCENHRRNILFRIQYQTRRNMVMILKTVHNLRKNGNIVKLGKYVEEQMGDYVVLKTHTVMPWKIEFLNEIYNIYALALIDNLLLNLRRDVSKLTPTLRLQTLLNLPTEHKERPLHFIFGDRSTYSEPDAIDKHQIAYKKFQSRLEHRMKFAKYGIERSYLNHEIARSHLQHNHFNECSSAARKGIEESRRCNSIVWEFLCTVQIAKSHASLHKIERSKEVLDDAMEIAVRLRNDDLKDFINECTAVNDLVIMNRRHTHLGSSKEDTLKRSQSGYSLASSMGSKRKKQLNQTNSDSS